mgnify:CR=1 FL=1
MKSEDEKKLNGTSRPDRDRSVQGGVVDFKCPFKLTPGAAEYWNYYTKLFNENGRATFVDQGLLACYCQELDIYVRALIDAAGDDLVVPFINGKQEYDKTNPVYKAAQEVSSNVFALASMLGLGVKDNIAVNSKVKKPSTAADPVAQAIKRRLEKVS